MSEATVLYPSPGSRVESPLVPYGTSKDVFFLLGFLRNQADGTIVFGKTLHECSYWDILFADALNGTFTFYLLGVPGGLLASVPNVNIRSSFAVGISQPTPGQQNLTACFTAAGYANPGGMPSGTVTQVSDGAEYDGTNPTQNGMCWTLKYTVDPVPVATSLFDLHVDVTGSGGQDNNGLGITGPCS